LLQKKKNTIFDPIKVPLFSEQCGVILVHSGSSRRDLHGIASNDQIFNLDILILEIESRLKLLKKFELNLENLAEDLLLTYAGLFTAKNQIWMMLGHLYLNQINSCFPI
jgi:hypothetical protein